MILRATFSKPSRQTETVLGRPYTKIRFILADNSLYQGEFFTQTQSFQKTITADEFNDFLQKHAGTTFKIVTELTETQEITICANRHGEIKTLAKNLPSEKNLSRTVAVKPLSSFGKKKNYLLQEGTPVPFLIELGVMTKEGKVVSSRYDKFRQINRFLEFIKDIVPFLTENHDQNEPVKISDFGCGKSYLTFAVYYYFTEILKIPVEITGIDLKTDVIENCKKLAEKLGYNGLHFYNGDVADFKDKTPPDLMITLHACDTATDYALSYAVENNARVILSVPCCQHEINLQMNKNNSADYGSISSVLKYGLLRERFASLATDALRAELLEQKGYSVQVLEFIDMEHTPKNILIRAVKKNAGNQKAAEDEKKMTEASEKRTNALLEQLHVSQKLHELFQG